MAAGAPRRFTLVGPGRAGMSLHGALVDRGWECALVYARGDDVAGAAHGVELCVVAVPDAAIASVASAIEPSDAVLVHLSGATPLAVLEPHRRGALHPLMTLPDAETGRAALGDGWFAVAGDPLVEELAEALSGRWFPITDGDRPLYHCAAAVAANHLVALLGQVERIASEIGVPFEAFVPLAQASLANVAERGPAASLTGPVSRGDTDTIAAHRGALAVRLPDEVRAYEAMVDAARALLD